MLTAEQIKSELAQLDELISRPRDLNHAAGVFELRQAERRREMLQAELRRLFEPRPGATERN